MMFSKNFRSASSTSRINPFTLYPDFRILLMPLLSLQKQFQGKERSLGNWSNGIITCWSVSYISTLHIWNCRFERPLRIVKRFGELLKRAPSQTNVATNDAGTQAVCLVNSNSTQTSTCSPKLKALQQLNKSQSQQLMPNAPSAASSSNSQHTMSITQTAASASFFHPNIRVPPAGRPNPVPILPRYSSKIQCISSI